MPSDSKGASSAMSTESRTYRLEDTYPLLQLSEWIQG